MARIARSGFTLIEALGAVVLLTVGVLAALSALAAMARAQSRVSDLEEMQRLAFRKADEIITLDEIPNGQGTGDFSADGEPRFSWEAERVPTGTLTLDELRVRVTHTGQPSDRGISLQRLINRGAQK